MDLFLSVYHSDLFLIYDLRHGLFFSQRLCLQYLIVYRFRRLPYPVCIL